MATGSYKLYTTAGTGTSYAEPFYSAHPDPSKVVRNDFHLPKEKELMRGLFEVFIVDPETGAARVHHIVARDESTAKVKALQSWYPPNGQDPDDYDYVIRRLGDVREKTPKKSKD